MKHFSLVVAAFSAAALGVGSTPFVVQAAETRVTRAKSTAKGPGKSTKSKSTQTKATQKKATSTPAPLPRYVSLATIKKLRAERARDARTNPLPVLQPFIEGKSLKGKDMKNMATNPPVVMVQARVEEVEAGGMADAENGGDAEIEMEGGIPGLDPVALDEAGETTVISSMDGERLAQAFPPGGVRPAPIRRTPARVASPRWVRYPLEFQLCGIGLGTKAVDKDEFNRIDRYGLFAVHGNPTAVVTSDNVTVSQQPPEVAGLFPNDPGGGLPDWAGAVSVKLDENHVQWLYRRDTYAMGFVVDRLGYVDAIVVAGVSSPIAETQLEDPVHTIRLGESDLRKVLFRYGYPDDITTFDVNASASAGGDGEVNNPYRLFEFRYDQSYNIVFTIRNNRVVRMYIFGDPDFFNEQRRTLLRTEY